ncbi:MAG: twin-arginine translocase TatA/TatE family subunit [Pseudomonadota bacterium]
MGLSVWQILIVVVLLILLFGRGKISDLMGDVAKGIQSFKKGLADEEEPKTPEKIADSSTEAMRDVTPEKSEVKS